MAEREARQRVAGVHEHRIAQRKLLREQDLAREVVAGEQLRDERRTLAHGVGAICRGERGEEAWRAPGGWGWGGGGRGEAGRHEAQPRIEADVLHRARHRLEPDHPASGAAQPRDPRVDGRLAVPRTLTVFADGERAHPPLHTGAVRDVERRDRTPIVAPEHRAVARILDRIAPDGGVERRHAHAHQAVAAVPVGEGLAEERVQRTDVGPLNGERSVEMAHVADVNARHHQRRSPQPPTSVPLAAAGAAATRASSAGGGVTLPRRRTAAPGWSSQRTSITWY